MPTGVTISQMHNELRLVGTLAALNSGTGPSRVKVYALPRAENGAPITGQALLADIALADPAGAVAGNKLTLTQAADTLFLDDGDVGWARVENSEGAHIMDCDCSDVGGDGQIKFASTSVLAGGIARMALAEFT